MVDLQVNRRSSFFEGTKVPICDRFIKINRLVGAAKLLVGNEIASRSSAKHTSYVCSDDCLSNVRKDVRTGAEFFEL